MTRKTVVIGRGLMGLELASKLAGPDLILLGPCGQSCASLVAQGVFSTKGLVKSLSPLFRDKIEGQALRIRRHFNDPTHCIPGAYEPFFDKPSYKATMERIYRGRFTGLFQVRNLPAPEGLGYLWDRTPLGVLYHPQDGALRLSVYLMSIEAWLRQQGVTVIDGFAESLETQGPNCHRISYNKGQIDASKVYLCAGPGNYPLISDAERQALGRLKFSGGHVLRGRIAGPERHLVLYHGPHSLVIDNGVFRVGSTSYPQRVETPELQRKSRERLQHILFMGFRINPNLISEATLEWGTRVCLKNRQPRIDQIRPRLYLCHGLYKNGVQLSVQMAETLSSPC